MTAKETKRKSGSSWFNVWGVLILGLWSEPELKDAGLRSELSDVLEVKSRNATPLRLYHNTRPLKICEEWSPGPEELSLIHEYKCWIFSNVISFFKKNPFLLSDGDKIDFGGRRSSPPGSPHNDTLLEMLVHNSYVNQIISLAIQIIKTIFLSKFCGLPYLKLAFVLTVIPITRTKLYFSCRAVGESETSNAGFGKRCQILAFSAIHAALLSRKLWINKR